MASKISGGCMCGAVKYESSADPMMSANCYCSDCRRWSGGAFSPAMLIPKGAVKITGELKQYEVTGDSGGKISRAFCPTCGSQILSYLSSMPDIVIIKAGSLDDPSLYQPGANIFTSSAPHWAPMAEGVQKFPRMPG